jgi:hypothetical protein
MLRILLGTCLLITCLAVDAVQSQELSTDVYPSEDELQEALTLLEIDREQFNRLQEIAQFGIDSTNRFLYDQVPNLSFFQPTHRGVETSLETEQRRLVDAFAGPASGGEFRYRFLKQMDENDQTSYRLYGRVNLGRKLASSFRIHREFSGRERFSNRSLTYRSRRGLIRTVIVGNFTQRLGLGTLIGYRGKLLRHSEELDQESFLFPDYGGFNGLLVKGRTRGLELVTIGSYVRDESHSLTTFAGVIQKHRGGFHPGLLFAVNRLGRRDSGSDLHDSKLGLHSEYLYFGGYGSVEVSGQFGDFGSSVAGVIEGRHRFAQAEVRYAGWGYGDNYIDLSSGSKAGNIRRRIVIEEFDFEYSSKRTGQEGGLIRTSVLLTECLQLTSSLLHARYNKDTSDTHLSTSLSNQFSENLTIQIDYLNRRNMRPRNDRVDAQVHQRTRLEGTFTSGKLRLRSYIAYNTSDDRSDYLSLFVNVRMDTPDFGKLEIWSNLSRLDKDGVEYWYVFIRNELQLLDGMEMAAKLGNAYNRDGGDKYRPVISLELRALL